MPILMTSAVSPDEPQQYRQPSRKGKKAWRKNVDISEIQEGLEVVRDEEIKGGVIMEMLSTDLFTLDTSGDVEIADKVLKGLKPLKAEEIIARRSAVLPVNAKKRSGDKLTSGAILSKRQRTSYVSHWEFARLRKVADGHGQKSLDIDEPAYDPWDGKKDAMEMVEDPRFSFLEKAQKKKAPKTLTQKPISMAASGKPIPAVQKPEGSYSYNPMWKDYEERLIAEGDREVVAEEKRLAAAELERVKLEASAKSAEEAVAAEARADLSEWDEDSAWEGFESEADDFILTAKRPERKTPAQRNRIKRRKEEEQGAKMSAKMKKRDEQAKQIEKIAKLTAEREESRKVEVVHEGDSSSDREDVELRRRKLGKISLPEKQLELVLPDELQESLRLLKPEGNLLKERYRSWLVRGKLESRRPISFARKAKIKSTEKWTHKDFMLH